MFCTRISQFIGESGHSYAPYTGQNHYVFILCKIRLRKVGGKKLRLQTAGPCFGDHIIPYHKAKMLYLSNLEKKIFRIAGALKLHFFGFSVLTISLKISKLKNKYKVNVLKKR